METAEEEDEEVGDEELEEEAEIEDEDEDEYNIEYVEVSVIWLNIETSITSGGYWYLIHQYPIPATEL